MEGGDLQVATWIKDEGFDTTIPSVMQVPQPRPLQDLRMCVLPALLLSTRRSLACARAFGSMARQSYRQSGCPPSSSTHHLKPCRPLIFEFP